MSDLTRNFIPGNNKPTVRCPSYDILAESGPTVKDLIKTLNIPTDFYLKETDRPAPTKEGTKSACTTIYYLISSKNPIGKMHRNTQGRSIHVVQKGRGVYVLIYPDGSIESFIVGMDHSKGEVSQFIVPPNVWKGCYVCPQTDDQEETNDDLIFASEVVIPGFDFTDMDFMDEERLVKLVGTEKADQLKFML